MTNSTNSSAAAEKLSGTVEHITYSNSNNGYTVATLKLPDDEVTIVGIMPFVSVGDFVEIKNANIGDGTKLSHLTYVGDADVGKKINFGCGTVVVNYDGKNKHRTVIEDGAFIGCNTNLVAPVRVGENAFTAAGSTITDDVPAENLAIARARQVNKSGWERPKKIEK